MSEKTRNLMLKNSTPSSIQHHISNSVPLNVFRGTSLITQLEQQKYPTSFTAVASDYDNIIVPSCPNISIPTQTADSTTDS